MTSKTDIIRNTVARHFGYEPEDLLRHSGVPRRILARRFALAVARSLLHLSGPGAGAKFHCTHGTVYRAERAVADAPTFQAVREACRVNIENHLARVRAYSQGEAYEAA